MTFLRYRGILQVLTYMMTGLCGIIRRQLPGTTKSHRYPTWLSIPPAVPERQQESNKSINRPEFQCTCTTSSHLDGLTRSRHSSTVFVTSPILRHTTVYLRHALRNTRALLLAQLQRWGGSPVR
ncbi:hypothetical protein CC79DRAFT_1063775 [Sarocladium strictum]